MLGVGFKTGDLLSQAPPSDFLQPLDEHGVVQVRGNDTTVDPHARFDQEREIGCAGADIECPTTCRNGHIGGSNGLPPVVEPKAQERVIQVVDAGNRGEHPLNGLFTGLARPSRYGDRGLRGVRPLLNRRYIHMYHESVVAPAFLVCQDEQGGYSTRQVPGRHSPFRVRRQDTKAGSQGSLQRLPK